MATKITQTCDKCHKEIKDYDHTRCVGVEHNSLGLSPSYASRLGTPLWAILCFMLWSEDTVKIPEALHFHSDDCATKYLDDWLLDQRVKAAEAAEAAKEQPAAPAAQDLDFALPAQSPADEHDAQKKVEDLAVPSVIDAEFAEVDEGSPI